MNEHSEMRAALSELGQARRAAMLGELRGAMRRRVVRRRAGRAAAGVGLAAIGVVGGVTVWGMVKGGAASPRTARVVVAEVTAPEEAPGGRTDEAVTDAPSSRSIELVAAPTAPGQGGISCVIFSTDPAVATRFVISGGAPGSGANVEMLEDEDLLRALARTGNVYGLVRVGGHAEVTCYTCDGGPTRSPFGVGGPGVPPSRPGDV